MTPPARVTPENKCARCKHPQSWHRHDDADSHDPSDPNCPFRCLGYDCDKPGFPAGTPENRCGCPDFVALTTLTAQQEAERPESDNWWKCDKCNAEESDCDECGGTGRADQAQLALRSEREEAAKEIARLADECGRLGAAVHKHQDRAITLDDQLRTERQQVAALREALEVAHVALCQAQVSLTQGDNSIASSVIREALASKVMDALSISLTPAPVPDPCDNPRAK